MIDFVVKGAIFDVDDTLLDNNPDESGMGLHERSRLEAVHTVGKKHGITELLAVTPQQNTEAFTSAPVHTLESSVWNLLVMIGLADSEVTNPEEPIFREICELKNDLHADVLREHGREVSGATKFVQALGAGELRNKLAIASSAVRRDIEMFMEMSGLKEYFPDERIKAKDSITHAKPNPEVYNLAFDSLGLPESDRQFVCAFEDDPRGIMSAKAAGLYVCAITTRFSRQNLAESEVPPDLIADSFEEFADLFGLEL